MLITLNDKKSIRFYRETEIYIGEKNFDEIAVFLPSAIDGNLADNLQFVLHLVNKQGEYIKKNLEIQTRNNKKVGSAIVTADLTDIAQDFYLYIEMIGGNDEVIGKTNVLSITINPLPDETDRIIPKEEYEETIDELTEIIEANTEAMNRISEFTNGKSAYEIAVDNGFEGTESEWLASLKGEQGIQGIQGEKGEQGIQGVQGEKGARGSAGANGVSATHSWNGTTLTITSASGTSSADLKGATGAIGATGATGKSAYEVAVDEGFSGTEQEWLESLKGADGQDGQDAASPLIVECNIDVDEIDPNDATQLNLTVSNLTETYSDLVNAYNQGRDIVFKTHMTVMIFVNGVMTIPMSGVSIISKNIAAFSFTALMSNDVMRLFYPAWAGYDCYAQINWEVNSEISAKIICNSKAIADMIGDIESLLAQV